MTIIEKQLAALRKEIKRLIGKAEAIGETRTQAGLTTEMLVKELDEISATAIAKVEATLAEYKPPLTEVEKIMQNLANSSSVQVNDELYLGLGLEGKSAYLHLKVLHKAPFGSEKPDWYFDQRSES